MTANMMITLLQMYVGTMPEQLSHFGTYQSDMRTLQNLGFVRKIGTSSFDVTQSASRWIKEHVLRHPASVEQMDEIALAGTPIELTSTLIDLVPNIRLVGHVEITVERIGEVSSWTVKGEECFITGMPEAHVDAAITVKESTDQGLYTEAHILAKIEEGQLAGESVPPGPCPPNYDHVDYALWHNAFMRAKSCREVHILTKNLRHIAAVSRDATA